MQLELAKCRCGRGGAVLSAAAAWPGGPVVVAAGPDHDEAARSLAAHLGASTADAAAWASAPGPPVVVWVDGDGFALRGPPRGAAPRRPPRPPRRARRGREALVRALGGPATATHVVDATAGWGADAGVLATSGARVTMIERSAVAAAILAEALRRWRVEGVAAAERLELLEGEALDHLARGTLAPDVVYLDPFYAGRDGAATTAADLRWLRVAAGWGAAAGGDAGRPSEAALLTAARAAATRRVVVKRPLGAAPLAQTRPSGSLRGRTTRFDLYAPLRAAVD